MIENTRTMVCWRVCLCAVLLVASAIPASAQVFYSDQTYRIFLRDGDALPSLGDYAVVADRVVFTLPLGAPGTHQELQLMSLPVELVDMERTARYAHAVRASRYAATRGEADYLAMTDEVARALNELRDLDDPATRLALAEEARRRLLAWSGENYAYRAADIQELAGLFEQVIAELRAAAGESSFALDLSTGPIRPTLDGDPAAGADQRPHASLGCQRRVTTAYPCDGFDRRRGRGDSHRACAVAATADGRGRAVPDPHPQLNALCHHSSGSTW
jgi:hypothetical protein